MNITDIHPDNLQAAPVAAEPRFVSSRRKTVGPSRRRAAALLVAMLAALGTLVSSATPASAQQSVAPFAGGRAQCSAAYDSFSTKYGVLVSPGQTAAVRARINKLGDGTQIMSSWVWGQSDGTGAYFATWSGTVNGERTGYQIQVQGGVYTTSGWVYSSWTTVNHHHVDPLVGSGLDALTGRLYCAV